MKLTLTMKRRAADLAKEIKEFDRQCNEEEYTDTEYAWDLLNQVRRFLMKIK